MLEGVQTEFLCSALLGAFWLIDCTLPYLQLLCTSDASTSFGFGGAVAPCTLEQIRGLARLDEKSGDFVSLNDTMQATHSRLGKRLSLPFAKSSFSTAFSMRARHKEHINVMEGHACIRMVSWILRSCKRFKHRVVLGVDSKVWMGAAAKGRSSSPALGPLCRRLAALVLASGISTHFVFLYSEENPSDAPSRGIILRPTARRVLKQRKPSSVEKLWLKRSCASERLEACNML